MADLSVIVPIYNSEKTLKRCLDSVVNQRFHDIEIILVDDGSTDDSYAICQKYGELDNRIKIIHKEKNEGLVAARKTGVLAASSEFIGYVDSDDWIEPDMYQTLLDVERADHSDLVICGHYLENETGTKEQLGSLEAGPYNKPKIVNEIYPSMMYDGQHGSWTVYPYVWEKLYKRRMLLPIQTAVDNDICIGEDVAVTYPYITKCSSLSVVKKALYHYCCKNSSMVNKRPDYCHDMPGYIKLYQCVESQFNDTECKDILIDQLLPYMVNNVILPRSSYLLQEVMKWDELFPYRGVAPCNVVIYGAGLFGENLYEYLIQSDRWKVISWLDKNAEALSRTNPNVRVPRSIQDLRYDRILIAIIDERIQKAVFRDLVAFGVESNKISCPDQQWITEVGNSLFK